MGYKVQKGDGWYKIAKNTGMDVNELLKLNNATLNTVIHPGQEIKTKDHNNQFGLGNYVQGFAKKEASNTMPTPYKSDYSKEQFIKDNARSIQQQLVDAGYDLGKYGVDGKWGKTSQAALDKALSEGYELNRGKLISPKKDNTKSTNTPSNPFIPAGYQAGAVRHLQEQATQTNPKKESKEESEKPASQSTKVMGTANAFVPMGSQAIVQQTLNPDYLQNTIDAIQTLDRKTTPRQYTAAQNTIADLIGAPLRRGVAAIAGEKFTNTVFPTRVFNEDHLSNDLYSWLQDAVDKKWGPEQRKAYFEQNPDAEVKKGWKGRVKGTNVKESDYQKYYNTSYTGPMQKGFKSTMFGEGINQAQGTLGSFDLIYTKDGVYVVDDWDFGTGTQFDTSTIMGKIRQAEEDFGSQENSKLNPTRSIKAFIKYKD